MLDIRIFHGSHPEDTSLDTRAARNRLKPRGKPYYRTVEEGLHLGYRRLKGHPGKPAGAGKWVLRHYIGAQAYVVETIGNADDYSDADENRDLELLAGTGQGARAYGQASCIGSPASGAR